ncbi:hypothetical protein AC249_AIPGENE10217 [Exaiptasia diaphana]|nr:hypothetical protein AC249_AIPGENE10217 [Exaiptasia diaphana]
MEIQFDDEWAWCGGRDISKEEESLYEDVADIQNYGIDYEEVVTDQSNNDNNIVVPQCLFHLEGNKLAEIHSTVNPLPDDEVVTDQSNSDNNIVVPECLFDPEGNKLAEIHSTVYPLTDDGDSG